MSERTLRGWLESHPHGERKAALTRIEQACEVGEKAVYHWMGKRGIPAHQVAAVSRVTGIPCHELSPHTHPAPEASATAAAG